MRSGFQPVAVGWRCVGGGCGLRTSSFLDLPFRRVVGLGVEVDGLYVGSLRASPTLLEGVMWWKSVGVGRGLSWRSTWNGLSRVVRERMTYLGVVPRGGTAARSIVAPVLQPFRGQGGSTWNGVCYGRGGVRRGRSVWSGCSLFVSEQRLPRVQAVGVARRTGV